MKIQMARGVKDFILQDGLALDAIRQKICNIYELYGFCPVQTPAVERTATLSAKYAGGAEILKETFTFQDQGKRNLGMRYDHTVPLARMIALNPDLKMPYKRYVFGQVWRDGPTGVGRYREFTQCDADIIGAKDLKAEAELLSIIAKVSKALDLPFVVKLNNRTLVNGLLRQDGVKDEQTESVLLTLDKKEKIDKETMQLELLAIGLEQVTVDNIFSWLYSDDLTLEKINEICHDDEAKLGVQQLVELQKQAALYNASFTFDISLMRGLAYYTSFVYEIIAEDDRIGASLGGGGRYDQMIGSFANQGRVIPAVGISFGVDRIILTLEAQGKLPKTKTVTDVYIVPIGTNDQATQLAETLRAEGIKTQTDLLGRAISKNLQYANALGIQFALIYGENEAKENKVVVKNMVSGNQEDVAIGNLIDYLKQNMKK